MNKFSGITRNYSESVTPHKTKIDLYYTFIQISEELYPQLGAYKEYIESNVGESISMYGDSEKLARILSDILKNAISYGEDNGAISVSAREFPERTVVQLENKRSIPDNKLNLVFDEFYCLNNTRQSDTGGSGLGLTIAKDIVILHDGRIRAESNSGYTAFTIETPPVVCKDLGMANQRRGNRVL